MAKHGAEIWNWIDNGGYFYVCGDKNYMAKDVHTTLINICVEHGGLSDDDAKEFELALEYGHKAGSWFQEFGFQVLLHDVTMFEKTILPYFFQHDKCLKNIS